MFNSRNQKRDENLSQYLTELKALVRGCEFRDLEDELLRDRIVCGIHDSKLREKLLQVDDLTLSKCIDICNITETSAKQLTQLQAAQTQRPEIDEVRRRK